MDFRYKVTCTYKGKGEYESTKRMHFFSSRRNPMSAIKDAQAQIAKNTGCSGLAIPIRDKSGSGIKVVDFNNNEICRFVGFSARLN